MILKSWLASRSFDPKKPLCEIEVDGNVRTIDGHHSRFQPGDAGYIYHSFVAEGDEIGPDGHLFEFSDMFTLQDVGKKGPIPLHGSAKLKRARRDRYPKIFINYRRDDADAYAGRLHEALSNEFGEDEVFLAEFSIRGGEIWDWTIQQAVAHTQVMLALVGPRWLQKESEGKRRIDSPTDVVRREIVGALDRGTTVVPVLLPEAVLPSSNDFEWNDPLRVLPSVQFHRLGGVRHWKADVATLLTTIKGHLPR
jgi:TIR domain